MTSDRSLPKQPGPQLKALSCAEQRNYILTALRAAGKSSYFFRNNGCYQVPTRVHELRKLGHAITTTRVSIVDADGWTHPLCAFYELGDQRQRDLAFDCTAPAANDPASLEKDQQQ